MEDPRGILIVEFASHERTNFSPLPHRFRAPNAVRNAAAAAVCNNTAELKGPRGVNGPFFVVPLNERWNPFLPLFQRVFLRRGCPRFLF